MNGIDYELGFEAYEPMECEFSINDCEDTGKCNGDLLTSLHRQRIRLTRQHTGKRPRGMRSSPKQVYILSN